MTQYSIGELSQNPRAVQVKNVKKAIIQIQYQDDFLDYKLENIDSAFVTAALRLLSAAVITHDVQIASLLKLKLNVIGYQDDQLIQEIDQFQKTTIQKAISELEDADFYLAFKLAPIIVAFEHGDKKLETLPLPNKQTIVHVQAMLERTQDFLTKIGEIKETNVLTYSKNQAICGVMDWITPQAIIELNASAKKNVSLKNVRRVLLYYYLVSSPRKIDINYLAVYNPRYDVINKGKVENISSDVLTRIASKVNSIDRFANMSLMDRLK